MVTDNEEHELTSEEINEKAGEENANADDFEMSEEERAAQQTRGEQEPPTPEEVEQSNAEQPTPKRRGRKPKDTNKSEEKAKRGGVKKQPQIALEDEFLDEDLTITLQGDLDIMDGLEGELSTEVAQAVLKKKKELTDITKKIREAVPLDGKPHNYRVDGYLLKVGTPSEEKTTVRHSRQRVTITKAES